MKTICVIPAYNEEEKIKTVVKDALPYVDQVLVVDDGSKDQTAFFAKQAGAKVLQHIINRGQGAALETGDEYCRRVKADIAVHFDGDGQFEGKEIVDIIRPIIKDRQEIVFGSRFLGKRANWSLQKRFLIYPIARVVNRLLTGSLLSDPQNGFRALSAAALDKIRIENDGMAHNSEIQGKAYAKKLRIAEVPVTVKYTQFGQGFFRGRGSGSGGVRIVKDLLIAKLTK